MHYWHSTVHSLSASAMAVACSLAGSTCWENSHVLGTKLQGHNQMMEGEVCTSTHNISYAIPTSIIILNSCGWPSSCKQKPNRMETTHGNDADAALRLKWQMWHVVTDHLNLLDFGALWCRTAPLVFVFTLSKIKREISVYYMFEYLQTSFWGERVPIHCWMRRNKHSVPVS